MPLGDALVSEWSGKRVTLMGLGRHGGGVGAARWLARQGAALTVTDLAEEGSLAESLTALADVPVACYRLGGHAEEDFNAAEVVVVNPAVAPSNRFLALARRHGARVVTEIELLLTCAPSHIIGVTGSNGKTTTCDMVRAMLEADGRRVWLGGNIGGSLLEKLPQMQGDDWIVLELSSFQLHYLSDRIRGPGVAVITNCTPNHLDWHGDFDHYARAKQRLLALQSSDSVSVLNRSDAGLEDWIPLVRGRLADPYPDELIPPLNPTGAHQRQNAACAAAACRSVGCNDAVIRQALAGYGNLPHRIQPVAAHNGRRFYNDSKSTTPEATVAALASVDSPIWLLAGGYAKGGNYPLMAEATARQARGAALFGAAGMLLKELIVARRPDLPCAVFASLDEAFAWCLLRSDVGDNVLLSPGCASFDQYRDYVARAEHFLRLVAAAETSQAR